MQQSVRGSAVGAQRDRGAGSSVWWEPLPPGPVVKVCGLTQLEDVMLAAHLGAWALGFVFAPSPRRLTPTAARRLVDTALEAAEPRSPGGRRPLMIGVFGDSGAAEIAETVMEAGLDGVQLHGSAGASGNEVRAAGKGREGPLLVIQAVPVDAHDVDKGCLESAVACASEQADVVLLDTKTAGRFGGTGTSFCWSAARAVTGTAITGPEAEPSWAGGPDSSGCEHQAVPLLIAGGIGPANTVKALEESGAWGVDVSSGVERFPGVKEPRLLKHLFAQVPGGWRASSWSPVEHKDDAGTGSMGRRQNTKQELKRKV